MKSGSAAARYHENMPPFEIPVMCIWSMSMHLWSEMKSVYLLFFLTRLWMWNLLTTVLWLPPRHTWWNPCHLRMMTSHMSEQGHTVDKMGNKMCLHWQPSYLGCRSCQGDHQFWIHWRSSFLWCRRLHHLAIPWQYFPLFQRSAKGYVPVDVKVTLHFYQFWFSDNVIPTCLEHFQTAHAYQTPLELAHCLS